MANPDRSAGRSAVFGRELARVVDTGVKRLVRDASPVEILRSTTDAIARLEDARRPMAQLRQDALRTMRDAGWGYDRIAAASELSKPRIQQLVKESEASSSSCTDPGGWLSG